MSLTSYRTAYSPGRACGRRRARLRQTAGTFKYMHNDVQFYFFEAIACVILKVPGIFPIMFKGNHYERAILFSSHVGGDQDLCAAYDACTEF